MKVILREIEIVKFVTQILYCFEVWRSSSRNFAPQQIVQAEKKKMINRSIEKLVKLF